MARSGLKMVFSGAESASDATLAAMNKGGKASAAPRRWSWRGGCASYGVVPEFSFVLGSPPDPLGDMAQTFEFIRAIKRVNPATEIILYTYTPVPMDGALYAEASRLGFRVSADARRVGVGRVAAADDAPRRRHPVAGRSRSAAGSATSSGC